MPKLTAGQGGAKIDDGVYEATLLSIEERDATPNSPNQNPFLIWTFHLYDTEEGQELTAASSTNFSPKAKARMWMEAMLGKKFEPGEDVDTDSLCPKDCQCVVKNDPDTGFARIVDVMGPRRRSAGKKPATDGIAV